MSNALALNGAQPEKPTKFASMYVGRVFSGIWTNRSPLRDAASTRIEEKFYGPRGDAMIAGSNVEVTNKLTLSRRPGNPIYDNTDTYTNILAFDDFYINKALSDAFGTTLEQIDVMVDTATGLHANVNATSDTLVWTKTTGAGQTFMQGVGNELYFGNGIDNKKWLESLFMRNSGNNSTVLNTDSYPFMDTYLISNPSSNPQIQQMIGVQIAQITGVSVTSDVLTLTLSAPLGTGYDGTPAGGNQAVGTQFMTWGLTGAASFLNGATITLSQQYTGGTTLTANFIEPDMASSGQTGILQVEQGITSGLTDNIGDVTITVPATTGSGVPSWGTTAPAAANNFQGSITVDGNIIWVNRGSTVENWGIDAPTQAPLFTASGAATGWAANTYYSIASIYQDNVSGFLWQISTPGIVGATQPVWPASPTPQVKVDIISLYITGNVVHAVTSTQSFTAGEVVTMQFLGPASFLNGINLTVSATGLSSTTFQAPFTHSNYASAGNPAIDEGIGILGANVANPTTTQADNAAVWTCIQTPASLTWAANHHYFQHDYLIATPAAGSASYFQLNKKQQNNYPTPQGNLQGAITAHYWHSDNNGAFDKFFPQTISDSTNTAGSLFWNTATPTSDMLAYAINGAGTIGAGSDISSNNSGEWAILCNIFIPAAGTYTFSLTHDDGAFFSFDDVTTSAFKVIGTFTESPAFVGSPHVKTAWNGFGSGPSGTAGQNLTGNNQNTQANTPPKTPWVSTATWSFPAAGVYGLEIDYANWQGSGGGGTPGQMSMTCNGQNIAITPDQSGASQPSWPVFTTVGAAWNATVAEIIFGSGDVVQESADQYTWVNIGAVSTFAWTKNIDYTLPMENIVDSNGNEEGSIETGFTGTTPPTWNTSLNGITLDNGSLEWINEGPVPIQPTVAGKITATSAQGFIYAIALVNTLDNTVSNIGPLSIATGPIVSGQVTFAPGAGLVKADIDPQADYVAIFRTTDGESTELLIPSNGNTIYTVPLVQYLTYGYVDTTPDTDLDTEAQAPAADENTPPLPGAINLTYHLNRIWYSIGNTVFWTSGPDDPIGNGVNGFGPNNFDVMTSLVKRLVPTSIGMLVFTVSDIYIIPNSGNGTILPGLVYVPGVGISSYNALDVNGPTIGFFTTDSQFLNFSPSAGLSIESVPLSDQFTLQNGQAGSNWNPANVYVTWYASGQDMGWFVADGSQGWYRLFNNPAPDLGQSWSPFATIVNGVKAIKAVETSPGIHKLLLGPTGTGKILSRSLPSTTDGGTTGSNGNTYPAYAVFGSYVLAQAGQLALVSAITTKSVNVGSPLILGLLIDEALPYYTGSFEILKNWIPDPPNVKPSKSLISQRFNLSDMPTKAAACDHIQIMVQWPAENAPNELQSFTIIGGFVQEI